MQVGKRAPLLCQESWQCTRTRTDVAMTWCSSATTLGQESKQMGKWFVALVTPDPLSWMSILCVLNVHLLCPECPFPVSWMSIPCVLNVHSLCPFSLPGRESNTVPEHEQIMHQEQLHRSTRENPSEFPITTCFVLNLGGLFVIS